jgi:hypothetical protein
MTQPNVVPLQPLAPWNFQTDPILSAHIGTTDYLLAPEAHDISQATARTYDRNEDVWRDILQWQISAGMDITLKDFHVTDWFPRAPGLYFTTQARDARDEAYYHMHHGFDHSPIRDHAAPGGDRRPAYDYTVVFTPEGKLSMLQGGIGSIRL